MKEMIGMWCKGFNRKQVTVDKVGIRVMILIYIFVFVHYIIIHALSTRPEIKLVPSPHPKSRSWISESSA
jgi:hypothetical protein